MNWNRYGKTEGKASTKTDGFASRVKKSYLKVQKVKKVNAIAAANAKRFPSSATLEFTKTPAKADYLNKRCKACHRKTIGNCLGMKYVAGSGTEKTYGYSDLKYDIAGGRLKVCK